MHEFPTFFLRNVAHGLVLFDFSYIQVQTKLRGTCACSTRRSVGADGSDGRGVATSIGTFAAYYAAESNVHPFVDRIN